MRAAIRVRAAVVARARRSARASVRRVRGGSSRRSNCEVVVRKMLMTKKAERMKVEKKTLPCQKMSELAVEMTLETIK